MKSESGFSLAIASQPFYKVQSLHTFILYVNPVCYAMRVELIELTDTKGTLHI